MAQDFVGWLIGVEEVFRVDLRDDGAGDNHPLDAGILSCGLQDTQRSLDSGLNKRRVVIFRLDLAFQGYRGRDMDYVFGSFEGGVVDAGDGEVGDDGEGELGAWVEGFDGGCGEDEVGFCLGAYCCADGVACAEGCDNGTEAEVA